MWVWKRYLGFTGDYRISKTNKKKFEIKIKGRRKGDMQEIIADNSKIKKFIKWKPKKNSLNKIVKSCIKWELKH